jgi:sugar-specific transcriptional regulator TrmB
MADNEEYVQALNDLGLTHMQAKLYVALLHLKIATAKQIQKLSNIARQDIYEVLSELREKDLIEKIIAKPTKFSPVPPDKAISILIQRRNEMNRQLERKATQAFSNFNDDSVEVPPLEEVSQFILLSKRETNPTRHVDKLGKSVANAKKSVLCSTNFPLFIKIKFTEERAWKKAVERGVKFAFIISGISNQKSELNLDPVLEKNDNFEIRWTPALLPACVLIVDEKEAFCRIGLDADCPVLWSMNPSFVALIKDYFENKWELLESGRKLQVTAKKL